ncbi:pancreatic lipase-related protein 2-like protein [Dinothrombium tinctorium]|uniref:Pancreatic lipase-related protein 2-like protein n=1 Tax=Dinothrombium tinctorium TaxID=1965070 RepID=A0A3S3Q977_9ACAR|nr:pancreatic lipase-related protein 2-like protein [Dinothrombium tinctorium]
MHLHQIWILLDDNFTKTEMCYGVLGCFSINEFFDPIYGPVTLKPQSPEDIDVTYRLYTAENKFKPDVLRANMTREDIANTHFDPMKPSKFIIHGYGDSFDDMEWMGDIKDLFMKLVPEEFNIFGVDWSKGAETNYMQAVANTRVVGALTAHFINKLVQFENARIDNIHFIGFNLGAYISSYVGTYQKIGRLTGLDPAGPDFYKDNPKSRLDPTDATYVEVLHTDGGNLIIEGLGLEDAVGHDDYYPNGGAQQPGCDFTKFINGASLPEVEVVSDITSLNHICNHQRSLQLFLVNPKTLDECQFVGYECKDYNDFLAGKCGDCGQDNSKCAVFGFLGNSDPVYGRFSALQENRAKSTNARRKLYFKTDESVPYCLFHYQLTIRFDRSMARSATGFINMELNGSMRNLTDIEMEALLEKEIESFQPGHNYTKLVTSIKSLGSVETIKLSWKFEGVQLFDPTTLFSFPKLKIANIEVKYMSNIDPE